MDTSRLLLHLQQRLPKHMAVYAFGSRFENAGALANTSSDLDLAILVETYSDPVTLFELASELAAITHCHVDLLDFRAVSTVMQNQILTREMRQALILDVQKRGAVHGR